MPIFSTDLLDPEGPSAMATLAAFQGGVQRLSFPQELIGLHGIDFFETIPPGGVRCERGCSFDGAVFEAAGLQ